MTVTSYCMNVQAKVLAAKPNPFDGRKPEHARWFADTGSASMAVGFACECRDSKALAIAEPLAEQYGA